MKALEIVAIIEPDATTTQSEGSFPPTAHTAVFRDSVKRTESAVSGRPQKYDFSAISLPCQNSADVALNLHAPLWWALCLLHSYGPSRKEHSLDCLLQHSVSYSKLLEDRYLHAAHVFNDYNIELVLHFTQTLIGVAHRRRKSIAFETQGGDALNVNVFPT